MLREIFKHSYKNRANNRTRASAISRGIDRASKRAQRNGVVVAAKQRAAAMTAEHQQ